MLPLAIHLYDRSGWCGAGGRSPAMRSDVQPAITHVPINTRATRDRVARHVLKMNRYMHSSRSSGDPPEKRPVHGSLRHMLLLYAMAWAGSFVTLRFIPVAPGSKQCTFRRSIYT